MVKSPYSSTISAMLPLRQFVPLVAQALPHLDEQVGRVDELDLAPALLALAVGDDPDVGRDAGVVEDWSAGRRWPPASRSR